MNSQDMLKERFLNAKKALFQKLYDNLNEMQREAVFSVKGPLLVLAGAGTGKTTVLVNRIAYIVKYGNAYFDPLVPPHINTDTVTALENAVNLSKEEIGEILSEYIVDPCPPYAILSITFTNKAAREMKERLTAALGEEYANDLAAGTFHSVCTRLLRKFGDRLPFTGPFTIYDTDDTKKMFLSCMKELRIDERTLAVRFVQNTISGLKNKLKTPDMYEEEIGQDFRKKQISAVYRLYQKRMTEANALDFDDIIMMMVQLLREDADALLYCQRRFRYVCVDEFQDTNYAQMELVKLLSGGYRNLMVVGDDDQSIYRFRGADIENILNFDRDFSDAKVIRLEQNYRSTGNILSAANEIIKNNYGRHKKTLFTEAKDGSKIILKECANQNEEAKYIINHIVETVLRKKRSYSDFAILYRTNAQSNALELMFSRSRIPYRILGNLRFYDRKEIKDIMSYLALINNPADNLRLKRIINEPKRKIGDKTVEDVENIALMEGKSMYEIMQDASGYPQICKSASRLKDFVSLIEGLRSENGKVSLSKLFNDTIDRSGYRDMLIGMGEEGQEKIDNIEELISNAVQYEDNHTPEEATLRGFLEEVSLISDIDRYDAGSNAVTLMTIHSAKGLEFPIVFLPGMEEGIFPGNQAMLDPGELEEERRLAYVAVTRAKESLYLLHAAERLMYGRTQINKLSRFAEEIPDKYIEDETDSQKNEAPASSFQPYHQRKQPLSGEFFARPAVQSSSGVTSSALRHRVGDRVRHNVFGAGTVLSAKEMGNDILYEVIFDDVGTKKLLGAYAKLKKEN